MSDRITDVAAARVLAAIEALQVPQVVKDSIKWDVVPAISPNGFQFMVAIAVPVPGTEDIALRLEPPAFDPFADQGIINELVRQRLAGAQEDADRYSMRAKIPQNGHKTTPGGLHIGT